jgi:2,3-bisphosphoglycerate-dependent phosphoglycerate mutase
MKKLLYVLIFFCVNAYAQSDVTTFILVRHAEKATTGDSKDPMLSDAGLARAQALAKLLDKQKVNAIYSTNYHRTKDTVKPLAEAKGVEVQTYEKQPAFEEMIAKNKGGVVVICGHSNTTPVFANLLLGTSQFSNYEDSDYGNILIVSVTAIGKGTVAHLRY